MDARVAIAGTVQVLGYEGFWERVFHVLGLDIDDEVRASWIERDTTTNKKTIRESSIEGKLEEVRGSIRSYQIIKELRLKVSEKDLVMKVD